MVYISATTQMVKSTQTTYTPEIALEQLAMSDVLVQTTDLLTAL